MHHGHADLNNIFIGQEEAQNRMGTAHQQHNKRHYQQRRLHQSHPHALEYSLLLSGTVVLAHERRDGHAEGIQDCPDNNIGFKVCRPSRYDILSESVDAGLNQYVRDAVATA